MASRHMPGTPGEERELSQKLRDVRQRLFSPEQGDYQIGTPQTPAAVEHKPETPRDAQSVTMAALRNLFDEKLSGVTSAVKRLEK